MVAALARRLPQGTQAYGGTGDGTQAERVLIQWKIRENVTDMPLEFVHRLWHRHKEISNSA